MKDINNWSDWFVANKRLEVSNSEKFKRLFNRKLHDFMDIRTGFDIVKFDETIGTPDDVSMQAFVLENYGQDAVDLIKKLISY